MVVESQAESCGEIDEGGVTYDAGLREGIFEAACLREVLQLARWASSRPE